MSRSGRLGTLKGDLLTGEGIEEAVRGVDTIVHCASGHRKTRRGARILRSIRPKGAPARLRRELASEVLRLESTRSIERSRT
jgi:hypothetical protein